MPLASMVVPFRLGTHFQIVAKLVEAVAEQRHLGCTRST